MDDRIDKEGEGEGEEEDDMQTEAAAAGFSFPPRPKGKVAVSKKTIDGRTIYIPTMLASLDETALKTAANVAISRLQTMSGPGGLVVILSLSHTAILGKIEGTKVTGAKQQKEVLAQIRDTGGVTRDPDAFGLTLKSIDCFKPPAGMRLHKLNFAGVGAKSCVGSSGNPKVQIADDSYYSIIFQIIQYRLTDPTVHARTFDSVAKKIFEDVDTTFRPVLKVNDAVRVKDLNALYDRLKLKITEQPQGIGKKLQLPLLKLTNLSVAQFQSSNLDSGLGLSSHYITDSDCMFNKKYLRIGENAEEHYPALDWHVTAVDKDGKILVGNIVDLDRDDDGTRSTQIPTQAYEFLGDGWRPDITWMMDLITAIKIIRGIDIVTTKDILEVLQENDVVNVIFIDGGCNEFRDETRKIMIPCGQGDPSLSIRCVSCSGPVTGHSRGGMKNKKIKKPKTTKKKARIARTVRGRRKMRKSSKRYNTYKR
jgi:hypothetical protein